MMKLQNKMSERVWKGNLDNKKENGANGANHILYLAWFVIVSYGNRMEVIKSSVKRSLVCLVL